MSENIHIQNGDPPKKLKRQKSNNNVVKVQNENNLEMSALTKLPTLGLQNNHDAISRIANAVRIGNRTCLREAIEKARKEKSLDELDSIGFSALHHTTRYCRLEGIEELLKSGANVNLPSRNDHLTPLHIAARFGWYDAMEVLLKYGADVTLHANSGATALHLACRKGCPNIIELLLGQPNIDVNATDNLLRTPLHLAASQGNDQIVHLLLDNGADVFAMSADNTSSLYLCMMNKHGSTYKESSSELILKKAFEKANMSCFMSDANMSGFTLTHIAAGTNAVEVMKMTLDRGANVNVENTKNGILPIHIACRKGFLEMVELLVERGADIHFRDKRCKTPLHYAASGGHDHIIKFLMEKGASVDARDALSLTPFLLVCSTDNAKPETVQLLLDNGANSFASEALMKNCFHLAVECENYEVTKFLLENKEIRESMLYSPDVSEKIPLHYAAKSGTLKILKLILTKQKALNYQDEDQKTAIYLAAKANRIDHVTALGQAGASVNERDDEGMTALHAAASKSENRKVCKILISLGADVNCKDRRNKTPLIYAAEAGCTKTVKAMLKLGAQIDGESLDGDTALLSAIRKNNSDVVQLLLDNNAKVTHHNLAGAGVFETAVKYSSEESVKVLCSHPRWKEVITNATNTQGQRPMQLLIQYFPDAAKTVMNNCIYRHNCELIQPTHKDFKITYDFRLLDPGPDDPDFVAGNRYFGPTVMVGHKRQNLLLHPLTQKLLDIKWSYYGSWVYYISLLLYFWYMVSYSYFIVSERGREIPNNYTYKTIPVTEVYKTSEVNIRVAMAIIVFAVFQLFREILQIIGQGLRYFYKLENLMEWILYGLSIMFVLPYVGPESIQKVLYTDFNAVYRMWLLAIVSVFLSYINFVLFLRRFTLFGVYITMFFVVLRSLLKVMFVFIELMIAFAVVFYVLFREQASFRYFPHSLAKTIAMAVGELDFTSTFIDSINANKDGLPLNPFPHLSFVFFAIFVSTMSITLMNLLIGLAIGDIDQVQRSAELQRLSMQVEFVSEIEEKYPRLISRKLYRSCIDVLPNKRTWTWRIKKLQQSFRGALKDLTATAGETTSEACDAETTLNNMAETLEKNRRQIKALVIAMEAQAGAIKSIADKLNNDNKTPLDDILDDKIVSR